MNITVYMVGFPQYIWVFPKIGGKNTSKMDGLQWKTPIQMDDLGVPLFLEIPI